MEGFDARGHLKELKREFAKTDAFYNAFRKQFTMQQFKLMRQFGYAEISPSQMYIDLKLYADEVLSCAESVIYKDKDHPDFKLIDEVKAMRIVVRNAEIKEELEQQHFYIHKKTKEMIFEFYPEILDLSGNGLRLMELYTDFYTREFVVNKNKQLGEFSKSDNL